VRRFIGLAVLLALMVFLLVPATSAFAYPPQGKTDVRVAPVLGGPNGTEIHTTPATVSIPSNHPAIAKESLPSKVFHPIIQF